MRFARIHRLAPALAAALVAVACGGNTPSGRAAPDPATESDYGTTRQALVPGCGNGVVEPELGETCDDGNHAPFDGCDPMCTIEPGYVCVGERPSECSTPDRGDGPASYGEALHGRSRPSASPFTGRDFWTGFPVSFDSDHVPSALALKLAGEPGTTGEVRSKAGALLEAFTIPVGGVSTVNLPVATYHVTAAGVVTSQGVHVTADRAIRVLATNEHRYSTGTWAVWSTEKLGTDYRVLDLEGYSNWGTWGQRILFVGTVDGTSVTMSTQEGTAVASFTLDKGDTYQHQSAVSNSGLRITSTHPLAVIAGGNCDYMAASCDMTAAQLAPVQDWGRDYVVVPGFFGATPRSRHAVIADRDSTSVVITRDDGQVLMKVLDAGQRWIFAEGEVAKTHGYFVTADKPLAAATLTEDGDQYWDPSLVFWPPTDGYVAQAKMPTSGSVVAYTHFLSLITRTNATSLLRVNGATVSGWTAIASTGYSFTRVGVPAGDNEIVALSGVKFGAVATGGASSVSYGYSSPYDIAAVGGTTNCYLGDVPPDYEGPLVGGWSADADDAHGIDDEDALPSTTSFRLGDPNPGLTVPCNDNYFGADVGATVHAWVDFNRDGIFTENEHASAACDDPSPTTTGSAVLEWANPSYGSTGGVTLIRLRICDADSVCDTPTGEASSGEVEDHLVNIGVCGDRFLDTFEACDDGNTAGGDGCSATCTVEPNFTCSGNPSVCLIDNAPVILQPTTGTLTNQSFYEVSGTCEEGAIVRVLEGNAVLCSVACSEGEFTCNLFVLADGAHPLQANQSYAGLTSVWSEPVVLNVQQTHAVSPMIDAPRDREELATTRPTFSGICQPGASVTIEEESTTLCTATCSYDGTFSCVASTDLSEGFHVASPSQVGVGSYGPTIGPARVFKVDTTPPMAPTIVTPGSGADRTNAKVTVGGNCETWAAVTVYEGLRPLCSAICFSSTFFCETEPLANGTHVIAARQTDPAGNASGYSELRSFTVDAVPLPPAILAPTEGASVNHSVVTVSCLPGNTVTVMEGDTPICAGVCPSSSFTCAPPLTEGNHTVFAFQRDPANRTSGNSPNRTFGFDQTPPPPPALTHPTEGWETNATSVTFEGSCETRSLVHVVRDYYSVLCTSPCAGGVFACTATGLTEAIYKVGARQSDPANNWSPDSATLTFTVDTTPPGPVVIASPLEGAWTGPTPTISGDCEPGSTIDVLDGGSVACTALCLDGAFSCGTGPFSDGPRTLAARATDAAGNQGPTGADRTFFVDGTPPEAPIIASPVDGAHLATGTLALSGACETGAWVEALQDTTTLCSTACNDSSFTCIVSDLEDGAWSVTVRQTDPVGNVSAASAPRAFTVDTVAPGAPFVTLPAAGAFVPDATPTISGFCESDATVEVIEGSTVLCTATCAASSFACDASALGEGGHTVTARQTDRAGNVSDSSTPRAFNVDTIEPAAPVVITPAENAFLSDTTPTISGTCEAHANVAVFEGSTVLCTATCAASSFSCDASALDEGSHTLTARQTDRAGNESVMSTPRSFTVDTIEPAAPSVTEPADGALLSDATPTISGSCETDAIVSLLEGSTVLCTANCAASSFSCDSSALGDGGHTVTARQSDRAGNESVASAPRSFTVDTTAPSAPVISLPAADAFLSNATPTISGSCETDATVAVFEGSTLLCTATCAASSFSCTAPFGEGSHTFTARQTDRAGNESVASAPRSFTVDTLAPEAPVVTVPAAGAFLPHSTPTISGSCETDATVDVLEGSIVLCTATCAASSFSCDTSALSDGSHTVTARQTDRAGNESAASAPRSFTVDTTAPAAPDISMPAAGAFLSNATPTVSGSCETDATVDVFEGSTILCTSICTASSFSCDASALGDGSHTVTARQTDRAGNESVAGAPRSFIVDTTAPAAPLFSLPADDAFLPHSTPTISGSCETDATVAVLEGSIVLCTATCAASAFSCDPSALGDGSHTVTARQTDRAGNESAASAPRAFIVDTTAPSAPVISMPAAGAFLSNATPTVSGSCESDAIVEVLEGSTVLCTDTCSASVFSCDASALGEGSHTFTARQADRAGNESVPSAPRSFTVDTLAPEAPVITMPAAGAFLSNSTPTISGSCETDATVAVLEGSTVLCTAACSASSFACDASALGEGNHTVAARQSDRAGNESAASAPRSFTVDTIAPEAPSISSPLTGSAFSNRRPTISGTCETGAAVEVREGGTTLCSATCVGGAFTCTTPELADGLHVLTAQQVDAAGNESPVGGAVSFEVDTVPPAAPVLHAPAAGERVAEATPAFEGKGEPGSTVSVWIDGVYVCSGVVATDGTWSCTSQVDLPDGRRTVEVTARDPVGNETRSSRVTLVTIDTKAPEAPSLLVPAAGQIVGGWTTFIGMAESGVLVRVVVDGEVICTAIADSSSRFACLATAPLAAGSHGVVAVAVDEAGNESPSSGEVVFTVSARAVPGQAILTAPAEGSAWADGTPTYEGRAEPGSTVTVSVDGVVVCTTTASATGSFACSPAHALADGDHFVQAVASNGAGTGMPSLEGHFVVDRVAPQVPGLARPSEGATAGSSPAVIGTAEPGSTVTVLVDGEPICTTVADPAGRFVCMPEEPLPVGEHTLTVTSTDAAGNTSSAAQSTFLVEEGGAPDAVLLLPAGGSITDASPVVFVGKAEPGSTVTVTLDGSTVCTAVAGPSGDWTCSADLADGRHSVVVFASNANGTGTPADSGEFVVDTVAPSAPTMTSPASGTTVSPRPEFRGTSEPGSDVHLFLDGQLACVTVASDAGTFACSLPFPLAAGAHAAHAVAVDAARHASARSADTAFTVSPTALSLGSPAAGALLDDSTPTFSGKAEPGDLVSVWVDGEVVCSAIADSSGDWSCTPNEPLAEGARSLSAVSDDGHGGLQSTAEQMLVIDTVAPAAPIIDSPAAGAKLLGGVVAFAGKAEPGSLITVFVDGEAVCTTVATSDGSWSCDAELEAGPHVLTATAADAAGNVSETSAPSSFETKAELAAPVITSPGSGAYLTSTEVRFSGTAVRETTVTVIDDRGGTLCVADVDESGAFGCVGTARRGKNAVHAMSTWGDLESPSSAAVRFTVAGAGHFEGGGCSSGAGGASVWALLAVAGALLLRRRNGAARPGSSL